MTIRYNQTKNELNWSMGGSPFKVEPWGSVSLDDQLMRLCLARGLPLGDVRVPPEHRARIKVEEEKRASENAPLLKLKEQADKAAESERAARRELEERNVQLVKALEKGRDLSARIKALETELAAAKADKGAAESLLAESAREATESAARAIRAETSEPKKAKRQADG
jgi:hypothetical protein